MKKILFCISVIYLTACSSKSKLDQSTPEGTLNAVFEAAKSGDMSNLTKLCHAELENDADTKRICDCGKKDADKNLLKEFKRYFAKGFIVGKARIKDNKAEVDFKFGPNGKKDEHMRMLKKDGKWYLASF